MEIQTYKKLCVMGLGYIGLPTAATFASAGIMVTGVDVRPDIVETINKGKIHIVEPDLDSLVKNQVVIGNLKASLVPVEADAYIISVPTPFKDSDHSPDLSYIEKATKAICPFIKKGNLIILESTSPVGTTEKVAEWIAHERKDLQVPRWGQEASDIYIAHCPERVLPGQVLRELIENDRIVGGITKESTEQAVILYKSFVKGNCLCTNARTAEMTKLVENASRDVQIAFANELSILCDKIDINVWELIKLANCHPRVNILQPGCGVGGHCIAVDPWFLISTFPSLTKIIHTAREVNENKPNFVVSKINEKCASILNPKIACLGLAFKPDIDDLRESPALEIVKKLSLIDRYTILAVEPNISVLPESLSSYYNIKLVNLEEACAVADIIVVLVKHKEFIGLNTKKIILDFVNAIPQV